MHRESKGSTILVKLHTFASLDLRLPPRVASPPMPEQSRAHHSVVIATWEAGVSFRARLIASWSSVVPTCLCNHCARNPYYYTPDLTTPVHILIRKQEGGRARLISSWSSVVAECSCNHCVRNPLYYTVDLTIHLCTSKIGAGPLACPSVAKAMAASAKSMAAVVLQLSTMFPTIAAMLAAG